MTLPKHWPPGLGPSNFAVVPDDWPSLGGDTTFHYWFCGDDAQALRDVATGIQRLLDADRSAEIVAATFEPFAKRLSELALQDALCSATYETSRARWTWHSFCASHRAEMTPGPPGITYAYTPGSADAYYLCVDLKTTKEPTVEVIAFNSQAAAEEALATVLNGLGDTVTVSNDAGSLLRVRRELIVRARISNEPPRNAGNRNIQA